MTISDNGAAEEARRFCIEVANLMTDLKCEDVLVLDVRERSQVTDFIVIGAGTSERQMRSVADDVVELGVESGHHAFRTNRESSAGWVVVDFIDVTVHLFEPNLRAYYDLESLWSDAPRIDWRQARSERKNRASDNRSNSERLRIASRAGGE